MEKQLRKSQSTSVSERSDVRYDMWRKKVDNSLFRHKGTTVPKWIASKWELEKYFPDVNGSLRKTDSNSETKIMLNGKSYTGHLTCSSPKKRANKVHRLWFSEELTDELKRDFVMSNMRDVESALRGDVGDLEKEIPYTVLVHIVLVDFPNHHAK